MRSWSGCTPHCQAREGPLSGERITPRRRDSAVIVIPTDSSTLLLHAVWRVEEVDDGAWGRMRAQTEEWMREDSMRPSHPIRHHHRRSSLSVGSRIASSAHALIVFHCHSLRCGCPVSALIPSPNVVSHLPDWQHSVECLSIVD